MRLLIFRHGIAENHGPTNADASRRLTADGIKRTKEAALGLSRIVERPGAIVTSPKVRAMQTANILGKQFKLKPRVVDSLSMGPAAEVLRALGRWKEKSILVVGHEPTLSRMVEQLCTGGASGGFIVLKKSGCACLEVERRSDGSAESWQLVWLTTPKMLRAAGQTRS